MQILDGTGKGFKARVDDRNRLFTDAVSQSVEHYANTALGTSFSLPLEQTPTAASDYFFYLKNTGEIPLVLESIDFRVASAEAVEVVMNNEVGTIGGNTTLTPINLNGGSSKTITGDIYKGNDITGLSNGAVPYKIYLTNTKTENYNFDQDIILPQGSSVALRAVTGAVQISANVNVYIGDF